MALRLVYGDFISSLPWLGPLCMMTLFLLCHGLIPAHWDIILGPPLRLSNMELEFEEGCVGVRIFET